MATRSIETLFGRSEALASWSNGRYANDLEYYSITAYRHRDGRHFLADSGGGGVRTVGVRWITEADALDFIGRYATHPVSGYGYTPEEAAARLAGEDVRGSREPEGYEGYPEMLSY